MKWYIDLPQKKQQTNNISFLYFSFIFRHFIYLYYIISILTRLHSNNFIFFPIYTKNEQVSQKKSSAGFLYIHLLFTSIIH